MNKEKLVELGKEVAEEVYKMKEVKAVGFYGSIGLGYHDEESDVDLVAYVDEIPGEDKRAGALGEIVDEFETDMDWMDIFHYKDVEINIAYIEISDLKDDIDRLKEGVSSTYLARFIQNVRPILNENLILDFKERIEDYPEKLKQRQREELREITELFKRAEKLLERHQVAFIYSEFQKLLEKIVGVLYSVNERYYPLDNMKWLERRLDEMEVVPENFEENIRIFVNLGAIEDFPKKLELLKEMMFSLVDLFDEVDKDKLNIKSEDWYDEVIKKCKEKIKKRDYQ